MPKTPPAKASRPKKPRVTVTARQKRVADEIVKPGASKTAASLRAGLTKRQDAKNIATESKKAPGFAEVIARRRAEVRDHISSRVTAEEIMSMAIRDAVFTADDVLDANGHFSIRKARQTGAIAIIKEIKVEQVKGGGKRTTVKLRDAQAARRELGEYLGMKQMPRQNEQDELTRLRHIIEQDAEMNEIPLEQAIRDFVEQKYSRFYSRPVVERLLNEFGLDGLTVSEAVN